MSKRELTMQEHSTFKIKTTNLRLVSSACALCLLGMTGCGADGVDPTEAVGGSEEPVAGGIGTERPAIAGADGAEAEPIAAVSEELAVVEFDEGHSISFSVLEDGSIAMSETASLTEDLTPLMASPTALQLEPLELYLAATPSNQAVPQALVAAASAANVEVDTHNREVTAEPIGHVKGELFELRDVQAIPWASLCNASGQTEFNNTICAANTQGEDFCAPGLHTWHARVSSKKVRNYAVMAVGCGTGVLDRLGHDPLIGGWKYYDADLPADRHLLIYRINANNSLKRFGGAYRFLPTSGSGIRSWIGFW